MSGDSGPGWIVDDVSILVEVPVFRVRAEQCTVGQDVRLTYYVVDAPDWVNVLAITEDLHLVCVEQYRHARRLVTLEIPAGGCAVGESAEAAGVRELAEETGYAGPCRPVWSRASNPALLSNQLHTVLCYPAARVGDPLVSDRERTSTVLIPAERWLSGSFPLDLAHPYTALAVHDLQRITGRPGEATTASSARAALTALMRERPNV